MNWLMKYWLEWLFGILGVLLLSFFAYFKKRLKRQKYIEIGVKALLHDRLFTACHFYTERGWVEYDDLHNVQYIYEAYHSLDGNSTGTTAFEDICKLPRHDSQKKT